MQIPMLVAITIAFLAGAAIALPALRAGRRRNAPSLLALITETSRDAIVVVDRETDKIVWLNAIFAKEVGAPPCDIVGRAVADVAIELTTSATPRLDEDGRAVPVRFESKPAGDVKHWEGTWRLAADRQTGRTYRIATFTDVTQHVDAERRLRDGEERFQLAILGSNDGIWDWRIDDDKLFASPRAHELLGLDPDAQAIERMADLTSRVHPEDVGRAHEAMLSHLHERKPYCVDHRVRMTDGSHRWFRSRAQAIWDANGRATRMAGSVSDIDDLVRATKEAEQASELKSQFLANMSHEIRTPMNGVMGMAQLLLKTELTEKQNRFVDMLLTSSRALLSIINDILDLSKIESGLMTLTVDAVDMGAMIEDVRLRVEGVAAQKNLRVRHVVAPSQQGAFEGDARRIAQVLVNLIGNAVKFTDQGEVTLEVGPGRNGRTRFAVRDTGPGIPADQLAVIFERFRQGDGSSTRKHGGTGLGLAISKELVDLMQGKIGVESVAGAGSTFWFELPLRFARPRAAEDHAQSPGGVETDERDGPMRGLRALVAEDNPMNQALIVEALEIFGMKARVVSNGKLALDMLEREAFDLALIDIQMPGMNGDVVIQTIRASEKPYAALPIVVVTAAAMKGSEERYLAIGANAYVPKPMDLDALARAIRTAVAVRREAA